MDPSWIKEGAVVINVVRGPRCGSSWHQLQCHGFSYVFKGDWGGEWLQLKLVFMCWYDRKHIRNGDTFDTLYP